MELKQIYHPITDELQAVENILTAVLCESDYPPIRQMGDFVMRSGGKRIRPAMVILSAKAAAKQPGTFDSETLITVASAVELIHIASLIHDDVIDRADTRRNRPSVNSRWGPRVSVFFADYLYSGAFKMLAQRRSRDALACVSEAIQAMCEGELSQVYHRDNLDLSKADYIKIINDKTASLFAAGCDAGAAIAGSAAAIRNSMKNYGMNFGIAFQIADDYKDIVGARDALGKEPGRDITMGEVTLPIMNLLDTVSGAERTTLMSIIESNTNKAGLDEIRTAFLNSDAVRKTKKSVLHYVEQAKQELDMLNDSASKDGLLLLADYITAAIS